MKADLHTHSNRSDGTDSPAELIANAAAAGLDLVAITDHDTTAGWQEARDAAQEQGISVIYGIELSTRNHGKGQHLLGYGLDPNHPELVEMLSKGVSARDNRVPGILDQLRFNGIVIDIDEVLARVEPGGVVGRPHVADILVEHGYCTDRKAAFDDFLAPGGLGYVDRWAPDIVDALRVVIDAGGVPVIAHPRGKRGAVTGERFEELKDAGLAGIEVDHQEHSPETRQALRNVAADLDRIVTGASDYHGARKVDHDLGCNTTHPEQLERLLAAVTYKNPWTS